MRLRVISGVATVLLIAVTFGVVAYANQLVDRVLPPLWILVTASLAVVYRRLDPASPDRGFILQLLLLLGAFTMLFLAVYVPRRLEWLQIVFAGAMLVLLGTLLWVRRHRRRG